MATLQQVEGDDETGQAAINATFDNARHLISTLTMLEEKTKGNLTGFVFTLAWVRSGLAVEANALLRDLVYEQALIFMLAKVLVVSVGALLLWKTRTRPLAVISIFVAFLAYYIVFLYHLENSSVFVLGF